MTVHVGKGNLTRGVQISTRDAACRVSGSNSIPEGAFFLSYMDWLIMDYLPRTFNEHFTYKKI